MMQNEKIRKAIMQCITNLSLIFFNYRVDITLTIPWQIWRKSELVALKKQEVAQRQPLQM